jgi:hypothetical protein
MLDPPAEKAELVLAAGVRLSRGGRSARWDALRRRLPGRTGEVGGGGWGWPWLFIARQVLDEIPVNPSWW